VDFHDGKLVTTLDGDFVRSGCGLRQERTREKPVHHRKESHDKDSSVHCDNYTRLDAEVLARVTRAHPVCEFAGTNFISVTCVAILSSGQLIRAIHRVDLVLDANVRNRHPDDVEPLGDPDNSVVSSNRREPLGHGLV